MQGRPAFKQRNVSREGKQVVVQWVVCCCMELEDMSVSSVLIVTTVMMVVKHCYLLFVFYIVNVQG
jgi:hypothetical protein